MTGPFARLLLAGSTLLAASAACGGFSALAQTGTDRASTPLPYRTVERLSARDMLDRMGVNIHIGYQLGGPRPYDLPNRNGEKEVITALRYLGLHHIRNEGLDDDPTASAGSPHPEAPTDLENFIRLREAIPDLKLNYLVSVAGPPRWGEGGRKDPVVNLTKLAKMGALVSIEAPNEPNNQPTFSPQGTRYAQDLTEYNRIWQEWGDALQKLKKSNPAFANVLLLTPTIAAHGPNGADGVEAFHAEAKLADHRARYDLMNIHAYSAKGGISLGDPLGPVEAGMPPNYGCYQVSIANWGRYAMPGRGVVITESGANSRKRVPAGEFPLSEQAQGLVLINNYFWAAYYGAVRLYQYQLVDDSSDLNDPDAERWGFYRGDWSAKPAADYMHRFTKVLADAAPSDPASLPAFTVTGKKPETWGAVMALSKSDGSFVLMANNTLRWWDIETGREVTPKPENWRITLEKPARYTITDIRTGEVNGPLSGTEIDIPVRGYPVLVHVRPR